MRDDSLQCYLHMRTGQSGSPFFLVLQCVTLTSFRQTYCSTQHVSQLLERIAHYRFIGAQISIEFSSKNTQQSKYKSINNWNIASRHFNSPPKSCFLLFLLEHSTWAFFGLSLLLGYL